MVRMIVGTSASDAPLIASTMAGMFAKVGVRTQETLELTSAVGADEVENLAARLFDAHPRLAHGRHSLDGHRHRAGRHLRDDLVQDAEGLLDLAQTHERPRHAIAGGLDNRVELDLAVGGVAAAAEIVIDPGCAEHGTHGPERVRLLLRELPHAVETVTHRRFVDPDSDRRSISDLTGAMAFPLQRLSVSSSGSRLTPPTIAEPKITRPPAVSSATSTIVSLARHEAMKRFSNPKASAARPKPSRWLCTRSSSHQKVRRPQTAQ